MKNDNQKPIVFLAFANDRDDSVGYLRNLPDEARRLREVLEKAENAELCEVVVRTNSTADDIFKVFQDSRYRNRIGIFHYGGHADGYRLLLESVEGHAAAADAGGVAQFLGQQQGLQLVFLNGCSTQQQTQALLKLGISAVISTSRAIDDQVATDFAFQFYQGLASGATIRTAYLEAEAAIMTTRGHDTRGLYFGPKNDAVGLVETDRCPWSLFLREGAEHADHWNLPGAVDDPMFGLPTLQKQDLPESPYRYLNWFTRKDADVFFGRGHQIRELYDRITAPHTAPLLLFYGQSGVGKSSILDAGLIPRLEQDYEVRYLRRSDKGLFYTLKQAFSSVSAEMPLGTAWMALEEQHRKPLILFLDQVEDLYTRPLADKLDEPDELDSFLKAVQAVFSDPNGRPKGRLVLSFRKEWLAELESKLVAYELPRTKVFLEALDKRGIIEVVRGPTSAARLRERYGLTIEDGLAEIIADDLLEDRGSAIAPTLQILLSKMWTKAIEANDARPNFSLELYQQLKREGILLRDFLNQQIATLRQRLPDTVDSGLLLDVVAMHTTRLGTANQCSLEQLQTEYAHLGTKLEAILQQCQDLYLLTMSTTPKKDNARSTRLAHDTLAPLVREQFDKSDKPGQRARRILDNRVVDWSTNLVGKPLDVSDLELVEKGASGTRVFNPTEQRLIKASRELREKLKRTRLWIKWSATLALIAIACLIAISIWKGIEAQQNLITARQSVEAMLQLYLQIPEKAGDIAAAGTPKEAHEAFARLEKDGIPTSLRITSPEIAEAINEIKKLLPPQADEMGAAFVSEDCKFAILELVKIAREAWEARLVERNPGKFEDYRLKQQRSFEREIITSVLCRRAITVTSAIANSKSNEVDRTDRQEFERLYWAELYWLEIEEKRSNSQNVSPLEQAMVAFRRDGLHDWELEKASTEILNGHAKEVRRCCIALMGSQ